VDKIHEIEAYGYGGLGILPEPSPPPAVPRRLDHLYFRLKIDGERGETEAWERIHGSRALALYVPSELSTVKFELFAVLE
jgi:predicted component of type VI protein secretion system